MVPWIKEFVILVEDQSSVSRIPMAAYNSLQIQFLGIQRPVLTSSGIRPTVQLMAGLVTVPENTELRESTTLNLVTKQQRVGKNLSCISLLTQI